MKTLKIIKASIMKKIVALFITVMFVQLLIAQNVSKHNLNESRSTIVNQLNSLGFQKDYLAQVNPTIELQGEGAVVTPQEGKTETENVWVNRGLWIAVIVILIVLYISRRKKQ